ncbi:MAG TPA: DUF2690 domain-containing protein [Mycobacteriales bacterium]|jgi:hypothetical protein
MRPTRLTRVTVAVTGALIATVVRMPSASAAADGSNPVTTGCNATAITAESIVIRNGAGTALAEVLLRYSTSCRTAWTTVNGFLGSCQSNGNNCLYARVHRNSDNAELTNQSNVGSTSVFTAQLNDANVTSYAHGCIYYNQAWVCRQTASY